KGRIVLESATVVLGGDGAREGPGIPPGPYVTLAISDSAPVLDTEARERIFDPVTRAGGLGLSSVRDLVRRNGGAIVLLPGRERGNTFRVYLPRRAPAVAETRRAAAPAAAVPALPPPSRAAGGEVVLLAEDEDAVRSLIAETLRLEGYSVVEARDGEEAVRLAAEVEGPIDLLVTDIMMPRMGGIPLAARMRKDRPGIPVLFVTGYLERAADGASDLPAEESVLRKPFTPTVLAARVRDTLAARPGAAGR
ncbi:MAG TPA: response regulator, partial [Planctomycetota bacterium]|nr:response regulator [Planctomycetota bacterium]